MFLFKQCDLEYFGLNDFESVTCELVEQLG